MRDSKIGWKTAAALVISNMIGTGVFTSLGYQLLDVQNTYSIILIWVLGGVFAFIGALSCAELGTHFKASGGDYVFLSKLIHPLAGYSYAWISLTVGFTAPIAISVMAMENYLSALNPLFANSFFGIGVILILTLIHSFSIGQSGAFQNVSTAIKLLFIGVLIALGFYYTPIDQSALDFSSSWQTEVTLPGFAVALLFVTYAYTGWNSAAYIVDEIRAPRKNLPKALLLGTLIVTILYVLLQLVFLRLSSLEQLSGKVEIALLSFSSVLSDSSSKWIGYFIAIQLIATVSGYLWIGSRVTFAMAKDYALWNFLAHKNSNGIPVRTLWLQAAISILLTLTGTFEEVMLYAGFVLQLMGTLTVASVMRLKPQKDAFKSPLKPYLQIAFILFSLWILGYMLYQRPKESLIGLLFVAVGIITYFFNHRTPHKKHED